MPDDVEEDRREVDCKGVAEQAATKDEEHLYALLPININLNHVFVLNEVLCQLCWSGIDKASFL